MTPLNFPNSTIAAPPPNWDEDKYGKCSSLPILEQGGVIMSMWKPSFKERIKILFGGVIQLSIVSNQMLPVSLDVR